MMKKRWVGAVVAGAMIIAAGYMFWSRMSSGGPGIYPATEDNATSLQQTSANPHSPPTNSPQIQVNSATQYPGHIQWLRTAFSSDAFIEGIAFLKDRSLPDEERLLILDKLNSWRRKLAFDEIKLLLSEAENITRDVSQSKALRARAIGVMATSLIVMQENNLFTRAEVESYFPLLRQLMEDKETDVLVRGAAIRALGVCKADDSGAVFINHLSAPENINEPEMARSLCLALARTEGAAAVEPISKVLALTTNEAAFGTAAFSLGQISSPESLAALVSHENRFPDSGSVDAVLVDMEPVILAALQSPADVNLPLAISATRHLWKDGQRERYIPLLRELVTTASLSGRQAATERLIDAAASLPLAGEQQELSAILPAVASQPELADYARQIQNRLNAKLIIPDNQTTVPADKGPHFFDNVQRPTNP